MVAKREQPLVSAYDRAAISSLVRQKKEFQAVFENRMFERYILLDNLFHPGKCLAVYDKEGKTIWK